MAMVANGEQGDPKLGAVEADLLSPQPEPAEHQRDQDGGRQQTARRDAPQVAAGDDGHQPALGARAKDAGREHDEGQGREAIGM